MPTYVYQCAEGHTKEEIRRIADHANPCDCECGLPMSQIINYRVMFDEGFIGSTRVPGYLCPVSNEYVESKRKRLNIMAKHDLVEYDGPKSVGKEQ